LDKATSELVERTTYEAYGNTESDYRPDRWKNFREDYKFTGKEEDIEVGLQYFGYRYYAPALNRWISADPLAIHRLEADANCYAYVSGRALVAVDPDGLNPLDWISKNVGPSSQLGQKLSHGNFWGHSLIQDEKNLKIAQNVWIGVAVGAATIATAGLAAKVAAPIIAANMTSATAGAMATGMIAVAAGGVGGRIVQNTLEGKSAKENLKSSFNPNSVLKDSVEGGILGSATHLVHQKLNSNSVSKVVQKAKSHKPAEPKACVCGQCFEEGTLVTTINGFKNIEEIEIGDWVLSRNPETDETAWSQVTRTFVNHDKPLLEVVVQREDGAKDVLHTTPDHPFWVQSVDWTVAQNLNVYNILESANKSKLTVVSVVSLGGKQTVYNFEVADFHTYFVGNLLEWVHNACEDSSKNVALGLGDDLYDFSPNKGVPYPNWRGTLTRRKVENTRHFGRALTDVLKHAERFHFNLKGIKNLKEAFNEGKAGFWYRWDAMDRRWVPQNATNTEFTTVLRNPDFLKKTTFWMGNGQTIRTQDVLHGAGLKKLLCGLKSPTQQLLMFTKILFLQGRLIATLPSSCASCLSFQNWKVSTQ
jgi:RHS repeat-associated protein